MADTKISDLTAIPSYADDDVMVFVDTSDGVDGTTKNSSVLNFVNARITPEITASAQNVRRSFTLATGQSITAGQGVELLSDSTIQKLSSIGDFGINYAGGTTFTPSATLSRRMGVAKLTENLYVLAYQNSTDSDGEVLAVSITGRVMTVGIVSTFEVGTIDDIDAVDISSTHFAVSYRDGSNNGKTIIGSVSGTTITLGTAVTFDVLNATPRIRAAKTSNNRITLTYIDDLNNTKAIAATISGLVPTFGTVAAVTADNVSQLSIAGMTPSGSDNRALISFKAVAGQLTSVVISINVSDTITPGTSVTTESDTANTLQQNFVLNDSIAYVVYMLGNTSITAARLSISGTTISTVNKTVIEDDHDSSINVFQAFALSQTTFGFTFTREGDGNNVTNRIVKIAEDGVVKSVSERFFDPGDTTNDTGFNVALTAFKFIQAQAANRLVIGEVTRFIGIAAINGSANDSIPIIIAGTSSGHSGLSVNEVAYIDSSGDVSTPAIPVDLTSFRRIGIAVSATEVLLDDIEL